MRKRYVRHKLEGNTWHLVYFYTPTTATTTTTTTTTTATTNTSMATPTITHNLNIINNDFLCLWRLSQKYDWAPFSRLLKIVSFSTSSFNKIAMGSLLGLYRLSHSISKMGRAIPDRRHKGTGAGIILKPYSVLPLISGSRKKIKK